MSNQSRPKAKKPPPKRSQPQNSTKNSVQRYQQENRHMTVVRTAPATIGVTKQMGRPSVTSNRLSSRVRHSELVTSSLAGSVAYAARYIFRINPGLSGTFPWLSQIAQNWEQYTFHSLSFEFVPIAPTSTQGDVILSPNYDATDNAPLNEREAVNTFGTKQFPCWQTESVKLDRDSMMNNGPKSRKYCRAGNIAGDRKTFDAGFMTVACVDQVSSTIGVGKIWVHYDVEFFVPQSDVVTTFLPIYTSIFGSAFDQTLTNGAYTILTGWSSIGQLYDPLLVGPFTAGFATLPRGCYRVSAIISITDATNEVFGAQLQIRENGTEVPGAELRANKGIVLQSVGVANGVYQLVANAIIITDSGGLTTLSVGVQITNGAGVIKYLANSGSLTVSLA